MKQVYILTSEQAEELKVIQTRIVSDIDIIADLLKDEPIRNSVKNSIEEVLGRIEIHCDDMEDILISE